MDAPKSEIFEMRTSAVFPKAVAFSHGVMDPENALHGREPALMNLDNEGAHLILDFGMEIVGNVTVNAHAKSGGRVALYYGEDLDEAANTEDFYPEDSWYRVPKDEFTL